MRRFALIGAAVAALSIGSPVLADIVATAGVQGQGTESVIFADQAAGLVVFGSAGGQTNNFIVRGTTVLPARSKTSGLAQWRLSPSRAPGR